MREHDRNFIIGLAGFFILSCYVVFCGATCAKPSSDRDMPGVGHLNVVNMTESSSMFPFEGILIKNRAISNKEGFIAPNGVHLILCRAARFAVGSLKVSAYRQFPAWSDKSSVSRNLINQHASSVAIIWASRQIIKIFNKMKPKLNFEDSSGTAPAVFHNPSKIGLRSNSWVYIPPFKSFGFAPFVNKNPSAFCVMGNFDLIQEYGERKCCKDRDYNGRAGIKEFHSRSLRTVGAVVLIFIGIVCGLLSIPFGFRWGCWYLGAIGFVFAVLCCSCGLSLLIGWQSLLGLN